MILFKGAFGDWFSWQNTLQRAAPLMLTALCVAHAGARRAGHHRRRRRAGARRPGLRGAALRAAAARPTSSARALLCIAGAMASARAWIALAGWLRQYRGVNETISSLLLAYIAIGLFKHLVEGPLRDPASLNKPSTCSLAEGLRIGGIAGSDVHWGLVIGVVACIALGAVAARHARRASRCAWSAATRAPRSWSACRRTRLILLRLRARRRLRRPGRRGRGGGGAHQRQRVADRGLRLRRHPGRLHRAPQPVRDHSGGDPVRRLRRGRQPAAAPARPARRVGAGAAGHRLRADPGERGAAQRRLDGAAREVAPARDARAGRAGAPVAAAKEGVA